MRSDPNEVGDFQVYVRDQRGAPVVAETSDGANDAQFYSMTSSSADVAADQGGADLADGIATGVTITVTVDPASSGDRWTMVMTSS